MPRPIKGYTRPTSVGCRLCGGVVEVQPKGTIPEAHPECGLVLQDFARFTRSFDQALAVPARTDMDRARMTLDVIARMLEAREFYGNRHANPSSAIGKAVRAERDAKLPAKPAKRRG